MSASNTFGRGDGFMIQDSSITIPQDGGATSNDVTGNVFGSQDYPHNPLISDKTVFKNTVSELALSDQFSTENWWSYWIPDCLDISSKFTNLPNIKAFYEVLLVSLPTFVDE